VETNFFLNIFERCGSALALLIKMTFGCSQKSIPTIRYMPGTSLTT
jgi:hypothetical protein